MVKALRNFTTVEALRALLEREREYCCRDPEDFNYWRDPYEAQLMYLLSVPSSAVQTLMTRTNAVTRTLYCCIKPMTTNSCRDPKEFSSFVKNLKT